MYDNIDFLVLIKDESKLGAGYALSVLVAQRDPILNMEVLVIQCVFYSCL